MFELTRIVALAVAALVAQGASFVPFVLERYGKEKNEEAAARLREVLEDDGGASR